MKGTMPDLCTPRRGFRHDVDSAFASLRRLGVDAERIVLRGAGPGWHPGTVVGQQPAPGTPLEPRTRVVLSVAGTGGLELLPYPLREDDGEGFGVDRLLSLFDNPLHKLSLHVRQAGGFLALHPGDPVGALRWIEEIFQITARGVFPRETWHALALLLPKLHQVAGTARAVELAFPLVFGLPVASVRTVAGIVPLPPEARTRLGVAASRLGLDTVVGEGVRERGVLEVTFGPLDLPAWRRHTAPARRAERDALYHLVLPCHLREGVRECWEVGNGSEPARLGDPGAEVLLGVNARLNCFDPPRTEQRSPA